ncbi:hypothetical protein PPYR_00144 [Photinus pyralis]|uniref:DDE-1 domain-containing protein n=2 Tax=Photinus pyralis TaxID=7054 RepID=A0A5N4B0R3_PHOPY|nr:uncharacterized protein LOC116158644 [Photinus pyralis]KAB0803174.1 hypothetical protein PPYR_00144 [Photinus pyralis]
MACISASGLLLSPLIIYQGQNLWSSWKGSNDLEGTCYAVSEKGWMTTAVFNGWFSKFFAMVSERPLLVIMDGHVSHLDKGTIDLAIQNNITLFKLPPHATDILQPLDKCCFGPLKLKWNQKLLEWQRLNQRKLTKPEFADMICEIWNIGISSSVIKKSFESTGIFPCCRDKYPVERLNEIKLKRYKERAQNPNPLDVFELYQEEEKDENARDISEQGIEQCETKENEEPRPSTSFEHILLQKINKTNPEIKRRRKVDSQCAVLTSAEYLRMINEKEALQKMKKEPKKKIPKVTESSSDNDSIPYKDESDTENLTVEDIVNEENQSNEDFCVSDIKNGDYILVKFCTKKKILHYVALVESVGENECSVSYLRRKGDKFIFPQIPEKYNVPKDDVVLKLPAPDFHGGTARVSQKFVFSIAFDKFNVN